ncbi:unnamed protein product [Wuchereria bancrofti]|uniref:Uncharacterized protein n=1 Tax=Wuchereria bancrofti TaxID=6293 RepID=A0A3P7FJC0_WUCBA|nr:unnamed protein product [Wuchereria bancrofti]
MCIYGIEVTQGFDYDLYYNDPIIDANMTEHFDEAGMDLCQYVRLVGANVRDPFQEIVIPAMIFVAFKLQINDKHFIDVFITCCNKCQRDEENWRIYLKSQFLAHRYSIIETISKYHGYELTGRLSKLNFPSLCITEDYREIAVTGNNNVCFTYGKQNFINPLAGEKYPTVFKNLLKMGQYNATVAEKYSLGLYCKMNYAHLANAADLCSFNLFRHNFEYFCCCYGFILRDCQIAEFDNIQQPCRLLIYAYI